MSARSLAAGVVIAVLVSVAAANAVQLWSRPGGDRYCSLSTALKWTSVLSYAPEDSVLYPEQWSAASLWRFRLTLAARPTAWLKAEAAYEQRARSASEGSGVGGGMGILFPEARAPYRVSQIDEPLVEIGHTFAYRHELDRAYAAVRLGRNEITVGRQAVGWGRGLSFSAIDIFAPFTPLENDREWRRGIDALRGSIPLTDLISFEAVGAFGDSLEVSSFIGRLHGYIGSIDAEIVLGKRRADYLYGASVSAPVLDAELHGELALFLTPEASPDGGVCGRDDLIAKSVIGGSYSLDVGAGVLVAMEYHFSGFGLSDIGELGTRLQDDIFRERLVYGDTQILGRYAGCVQIGYGIYGVSPLNLSWIFSPVDGSGVLMPAATWVFSDNVTLAANGYLPYGAESEGGVLQSQYGGTPVSGLVQISFYY